MDRASLPPVPTTWIFQVKKGRDQYPVILTEQAGLKKKIYYMAFGEIFLGT